MPSRIRFENIVSFLVIESSDFRHLLAVPFIPMGEDNALMKAYEYQKKAAKVGLDWPDPQGAWEKVWEELKEFENEVENNSEKDIKKEYPFVPNIWC